MHYDDGGRRYNFVSGFLLGLGVGSLVAGLFNAGSPRHSPSVLKRARRRIGRTQQPRLATFVRELASRQRSGGYATP